MYIVECARRWLGTKFHYTGRIKINNYNKGGVDCIGLIMKVGEEIGSNYNGKNIINYDYLTYSRYPNIGEMKRFLDKYFTKIDKEELRIGDLIYFNFNNNLEHIAIFTDKGIIHCYTEAGCVAENSLNNFWYSKIKAYYRYRL